MKQTTLSIIVPLYNEEENILPLINEIKKSTDAIRASIRMIFVDDGSTDQTWKILKQCACTNERLTAVKLSRNFGKEAAVAAGLEAAREDAVIVMDGDLQHPPNVISKMFMIWSNNGADIINAVKLRRGNESVIYRQLSLMFYSLMSRLSGFSFQGASDFKLVDRKVLDEWKKLKDRSLFFREMTTWLGFRTSTIEFEVSERSSGRTKWSAIRLLGLASNAVMSVSVIPLQLVTLSGFGFLLLSIIVGVHSIYNKFFGDPVDGLTLLILINLCMGSLIMMSLGIIGGYLGKIYQETRYRPRYIVEDNLNLSSSEDSYTR